MKLIGPPPCFGICLDGFSARNQVAGALARQGGETLVPPTARDAWLTWDLRQPNWSQKWSLKW